MSDWKYVKFKVKIVFEILNIVHYTVLINYTLGSQGECARMFKSDSLYRTYGGERNCSHGWRIR